MSLPEAAKILGVSARTVQRWAAEGRFADTLKYPGGRGALYISERS